MTTASSSRRGGGTDRQAPIALIGLLAIGVIWAIHSFAPSPLAAPDARLLNAGCRTCGTVIAVRHSAHSVPVTFVEVKMADGSLRTVRDPRSPVSVGDVVELQGATLTPRDSF